MKNFRLLIFSILILLSIFSARAAIDLMGLTLDVREAGLDISSGNISIEIYDAASAGNLIYNSSTAFDKKVTKTKELNHE